ncbi:hypothetical protein A2U01_0057032, partial [Trifolium medium]|nr:hypothetical protein [Trifolium medium]
MASFAVVHKDDMSLAASITHDRQIFGVKVSSTKDETVDGVNSVFASNCGVVVSSIVTTIGGEQIEECFDVGTVSVIGCRSAVPCAVI